MPSLVNTGASNILQKQFGNIVAALAAGASTVVDARGMATMSVITAPGSTATISRVDSDTAVADSGDTAANQAVALATRVAFAVDWPFYRITAAGGTVRVACV